MFKTLFLTLIIFIGMIGYDNLKNDNQPVAPVQKEEQQAEREERNRMAKIFFALLPPRSEWPGPVQKFYTAFNMEEVIEPIRHNPNWTPLSEINKNVPYALVAIEDHGFYEHGAIDVGGILRATMVNLSAGEVVQGGSTLTQQLVKNVFLSHEQSMERKVEEAVLSLMLENDYSKDEIIELYLNTTYFGAGANGIKEAARIYFGKTPKELSIAEAAVIGALPYAPSALNPYENPEGCKKRQVLVLRTMLKYRYISQDQCTQAERETIRLRDGNIF